MGDERSEQRVWGILSREQRNLSLKRGEKMVTIAMKEYGVMGGNFKVRI